MKKLLLLFLLLPTLSFAEEIYLSCQVEAITNSCGTVKCKDKNESGTADLTVIDLKDLEILGILFRFQDHEWQFFNSSDDARRSILEYGHDEKRWVIKDHYDASDKTQTTRFIEVNRYSGKLYVKRSISNDKGYTLSETISGDCKKDDTSKQRF